MFEDEIILENTQEPITIIENVNLIDNEEQSELTQTPLKDEVIAPENPKTETKSTGVSTYISIPDIKKENQSCNLNMLTIWDKINMWTVFLSVVIVLIFFTRKSFKKLMEKISKFIEKYQFILNLLFLGFTMTVFLHPTFFNSGISGNINIFTMIEFVLFIILNSSLFTYLTIRFFKRKNFIFKDKDVSFSGISFLKKSMWVFTLTGILFFFFTESKIAFITLYIISLITLIIMFNQVDFTKLNSLTYFPYILFTLQIFLMGSLLGVYLILIIGTILTGYYLSNKDENKNLKNILKSLI
ncbi:MAG: hypothetical protein ACI4N3_04765 [Alphaproteobacteria bacterium]